MKNNERHLIYNKKIKIIGAIIAITIIIIALVFIILNKKINQSRPKHQLFRNIKHRRHKKTNKRSKGRSRKDIIKI